MIDAPTTPRGGKKNKRDENKRNKLSPVPANAFRARAVCPRVNCPRSAKTSDPTAAAAAGKIKTSKTRCKNHSRFLGTPSTLLLADVFFERINKSVSLCCPVIIVSRRLGFEEGDLLS